MGDDGGRGGVAQYEFDMPYQMACQEFVDIEYNKAKDGNRMAVEVKDGDWLILGSDGLFDNMFDEEIAALQVCLPFLRVWAFN